jgi:hypothetical protein
MRSRRDLAFSYHTSARLCPYSVRVLGTRASKTGQINGVFFTILLYLTVCLCTE